MAYMAINLGTINGYCEENTEFLIEAFKMGDELVQYFRSKMKYNNRYTDWSLDKPYELGFKEEFESN